MLVALSLLNETVILLSLLEGIGNEDSKVKLKMFEYTVSYLLLLQSTPLSVWSQK